MTVGPSQRRTIHTGRNRRRNERTGIDRDTWTYPDEVRRRPGSDPSPLVRPPSTSNQVDGLIGFDQGYLLPTRYQPGGPYSRHTMHGTSRACDAISPGPGPTQRGELRGRARAR